jgi:hypothetical protein
MSSAPFVQRGSAAAPVRNLAITASVLAWLAVLGPATFLAGSSS